MQLPNNGWWFLTECIQWLTQPFMRWGDWDQFCNVRICIYSVYIYIDTHTHTSLKKSPSLLKVSCETLQCMEFLEPSYQTYPILLALVRLPKVSSHENGSLVLTTGESLPSGKRLRNYGKIHHCSWENSLCLW